MTAKPAETLGANHARHLPAIDKAGKVPSGTSRTSAPTKCPPSKNPQNSWLPAIARHLPAICPRFSPRPCPPSASPLKGREARMMTGSYKATQRIARASIPSKIPCRKAHGRRWQEESKIVGFVAAAHSSFFVSNFWDGEKMPVTKQLLRFTAKRRRQRGQQRPAARSTPSPLIHLSLDALQKLLILHDAALLERRMIALRLGVPLEASDRTDDDRRRLDAAGGIAIALLRKRISALTDDEWAELGCLCLIGSGTGNNDEPPDRAYVGQAGRVDYLLQRLQFAPAALRKLRLA